MDEIIRLNEQFYILASSALPYGGTRVLKHGKTFGVFDRNGDIEAMGFGEQGIFYQGTRYLSRSVLRVGQSRPLFLSAAVKDDNSELSVDLSNIDITDEDQIVIPRGALHVARTKFLWRGVCYEEFKVSNYSLHTLELPLSLRFEADFADIFEVRGTHRERRGKRLQNVIEDGGAILSYEGLDGVLRRTTIECEPKPFRISASEVQFRATLQPHQKTSFFVSISCENEETPRNGWSFHTANTEAKSELALLRAQSCQLYSSNEQFNTWVNRSLSDVDMMIAGNPEKWYPYAGIPWFSTVFGRDGIITALECLWINPGIAKGVLEFLAQTQATEYLPAMDAEPGKVVHEMRKGEMAALGEVPFGQYYGSVDATPLFVMLAGAYYDRTADRDLIESIWPHLQLALAWMDDYGDMDDDGFVEYFCRSGKGLVHQGWKDSKDSVFHADGTLAEGPIALCEVQGYVFAAKLAASRLAAMLGHHEYAQSMERDALDLQERFEREFWCEDIGTYALALDGAKQPCRVRASNAGHCLFTGIAGYEHARRVAAQLMSEDFFTGWGIRTVARGEPRYNPMSYHNGSIWPHDNAMIASGLGRYGFKESAVKLLSAMLDVNITLESHRLPELFCGFPRRPGEGPTLYPVACSPQVWAAGTVFMVLEACLGMTINGNTSQVAFRLPRLPESIQHLHIQNLAVKDARLGLSLEHLGEDVKVRISHKQGQVEVGLRSR